MIAWGLKIVELFDPFLTLELKASLLDQIFLDRQAGLAQTFDHSDVLDNVKVLCLL